MARSTLMISPVLTFTYLKEKGMGLFLPSFLDAICAIFEKCSIPVFGFMLQV